MASRAKGEWILAAADFSDASRAALRFAAGFAKDRAASLVVLHAVEDGAIEELARISGVDEAEMRARLVADRTARLAALLEEVGLKHAERFVSVGAPVPQILRKAEELAVDWIVLGTAGRAADWQRAFFGGTAEKVLRAAICPVLVVPLGATR
jgi:nucleotide-binding universal stress UspA family protein